MHYIVNILNFNLYTKLLLLFNKNNYYYLHKRNFYIPFLILNYIFDQPYN